MNLGEQLTSDLKQAMLSKDSMAVSVLRLLRSELKNAEIASGDSLSEDQSIQVIRKEVKKRREAAASFRQAGSEERATGEEAEATVLESYLPTQADPAAIEAFVKSIVVGLAEAGPKQRGDVIRQTMAKFGSAADGKVVAGIVSRLLP